MAKITTKYIYGNDIVVYLKDSRSMKDVKDSTVNLIITSPPYWNLKDYNNSNQIGFGDSSYEDYIKNLNKVWKECIRILAVV